ncbi:Radical SAM domain protein [Pseudopedobacter saltans DSM 12145]|uniref:7-carboxy-7-deazaguanine synthase n=1 Tax=Pseudopedobacter saltans (strain ATCC 51119 / DSM 12145 / JCM 21818 / CCUG 39354 / LMG 10337 / NBRC 100064 / NCIMB 13643) TaxID=762903 RepID=F0SBI7_PSESL|nr:7-carboxy-7-deazaguanine synthase QueE [Pseudopedobacter saltans]ADY51633.1 Radical SAM domain protein [Pseudopedobacter saltans DSM 12145]
MKNNIPEDGSMLPLMEEFYTIQGEGFNTGKAAYFIRLGGCDVGCHWCDVKESWDAELHPLTSADKIVENAEKYPGKAVVITGGEPLLYNLDYLTAKLKEKGILTFIETSGAYPISGSWDWVCLSPKKFKSPSPNIAQHADELKIIVFNKSDFEWAEAHARTVGDKCKLYLQPEWSKSQDMLPLIIEYVKENPKWEISLQTHKYLNIP